MPDHSQLLAGTGLVGRPFWVTMTSPTSARMFEKKDRPAWLNWLFLGIFMLSSWQLAGFWFEKLHG